MNFQDYTYERPNIEALKSSFLEALGAFKIADNAQSALSVMTQINQLLFDFQTMATLSSIRHSLDVNDTFYDEEKTFFDQNGPQFSQLNNLYYQALVTHPLRGELEKGSVEAGIVPSLQTMVHPSFSQTLMGLKATWMC